MRTKNERKSQDEKKDIFIESHYRTSRGRWSRKIMIFFLKTRDAFYILWPCGISVATGLTRTKHVTLTSYNLWCEMCHELVVSETPSRDEYEIDGLVGLK